MILYKCTVEYMFNQIKKGEVYGCQCCDFEIEVKKACDCGTNDNCETHDETHECCEFTCCGKPLVKKG